MISPPQGFEPVALGHASIWVRPEAREWIVGVMSTAPTLHGAAARLGGTRMTGRAPVFAVPTPHGTWVVRHFVRGGSVATALGDRYLARGTPRPFAEASVSDELRARGLETPRVIAAAVYRAGLFYRGDLVTELVPDAEELAEVLFDDRPAGLAATADRKAALKETGALIHRLGRKGVRHVDLNAKNILVSWSGGVPSVYLLDLDRCRVGTHPVPVGSMVRRLLRSLRKFERRTGLRLPEAETGLLVDAAHGRVS